MAIPEVYLSRDGWSWKVTNQSGSRIPEIAATRKYINPIEDIPGQDRIPLPSKGDKWDETWDQVIVRSVETRPLNGNPQCGWEYLVYYESYVNIMRAQPLDRDEYPISIDVGGENVTFDPGEDSGYTWESDATVVSQPITKRVVLVNIRISIVIKNLEDFVILYMSKVGKVNDAIFRGFPINTVLFEGCNISEFRNRYGYKRYRVTLNFAVRSATGVMTSNLDGWNYELREDTGTWDRAMKGGNPVYEETDFDDLFTQVLGSEEDLYPEPPTS